MMKTSEKIDLISAAMVNVQKELTTAKKDSENPHFRSKYADLQSIVEACRPALTKHGIAVIQGGGEGISVGGNYWKLTTRLQHSSGQYIESEYPLVSKDPTNPQAMASATTYAKRNALAAMVGVVADEDDDGNKASAGQVTFVAGGPTNQGPGDALVAFGKMKGTPIKNLAIDDIIENLDYWNNRLSKEGKSPTGALAHQLDAMRAFLDENKVMQKGPSKEDDIKW